MVAVQQPGQNAGTAEIYAGHTNGIHACPIDQRDSCKLVAYSDDYNVDHLDYAVFSYGAR
jgi:hypothetical protein